MNARLLKMSLKRKDENLLGLKEVSTKGNR